MIVVHIFQKSHNHIYIIYLSLRPADESAKFQNIPTARGSVTDGRLAKGEMLGAGSGDDPLYTGLWAQPAHRRCHPRYIVGLLHYASWTETDNSKRHIIIALFLQRQFFICHYNLIQLALARPAAFETAHTGFRDLTSTFEL